MADKLVVQQIAEERNQGHSTRGNLYTKLEEVVGIPVVSFFTSFRYAVQIEDSDADMLESILQKCDLSNGFALLLSSPGGNGLSAERIINICRAYSGTGEYTVIVPGKAKSAATMICLGASKIIMGQTSELGPIDPQIVIEEEEKVKWFSIHNIISSYNKLFNGALKEKGHIEPYLQQLANYDAREIEEFRSALSLSEDIAIKTLKAGMFSDLSENKIRERIGVFLTPEETKVHGRPIYAQEAKHKCKLKIEIKGMRDEFWVPVRELYIRLYRYVTKDNIGKCIECQDYSFRATTR